MIMHNYVNIVLALFDDTVLHAYTIERIEIPSQTLYTNIALMYIYCLIY